MKKSYRFSLLTLPLFMLACNGADTGSQLDSGSAPGAIRARLELGQAYDLDRAKWGNMACVTGEVEDQFIGSDASVSYVRDMSFDDLLKDISGELAIGATFPSVSVDAKADYAAKNSSTEFRETHTLKFKFRTRSKFKNGTHSLTEKGSQFANKEPWILRDRCKDEFVNEIIYGAGYSATMSIEFKNKEDKEKFGGSLKVDILQGKVTVDGKLKVANEDIRKGIKIRLEATQEGGTPLQLATVLTPDVASCNAVNLEPCLEGFRKLIEYANAIPEQVAPGGKLDTNRLTVLSYNTESYADTGLDELVSDEADEADDDVIDARFNIEMDLEKTRQQIVRGEFLNANHAAALSADQTSQLPVVQIKLKKNKALLTKALEFCYKNPFGAKGLDGRRIVPCKENYESTLLKLETIPTEIFSIPSAGTPVVVNPNFPDFPVAIE